MITKRIRANLIAQIKERGTLASSTPANTITMEAAAEPRTMAIAAMMKRNRTAEGMRWLPDGTHLVILP